MSSMTDYLENKTLDFILRGQSFTAPTVLAHALIYANKGYSSAVRSQAVTSGDYVIPTTPNGRLYKCTTSGTCGAGEPTWPTTSGGTVSDGSAVWTEQTTALEAGTFPEVPNSGNYSRQTLNPSLTNWKSTQGDNNVSSGSGGQTSNSVAITYGTPSANWGLIWGCMVLDSATYGAGNPLFYFALTTPKTVNNGDAAPSFAIGALTNQIDN